MTSETNKQHGCDQQHPSHNEWMIDSSDPGTARFLEPLTDLDADFWKNWNAEDVACAMAYFAVDTLRSLYANDPNFDGEMAFGQCMLAARRAVFDYAGMLTEQDCQQMTAPLRLPRTTNDVTFDAVEPAASRQAIMPDMRTDK